MKRLMLILCISQLWFAYSKAQNQFFVYKVCATGMVLGAGSVLSDSLSLKDSTTGANGEISPEGKDQLFGFVQQITGLLGGLLGGLSGSRSMGDNSSNDTLSNGTMSNATGVQVGGSQIGIPSIRDSASNVTDPASVVLQAPPTSKPA